MRVVALESTFYFGFASRAYATGIPAALAGGTAANRLNAVEMDSVTGDELSGLTCQAHDVLTAWNACDCDATAANGYEAGKTYSVVIATGTVATVSAVGEQVYEFRIETAAELAAREFAEAMYPGHVLGTQTGAGTTTTLNLVGIVNATDTAGQLVGEVLAVRDSTLQMILVRVTDYVVSNQIATVVQLNGGVMDFTPASGDMCWRIGQYTADTVMISGDLTAADNLELFTEGTALATLPQVDVAQVSSDTTAADNLELFFDGTGYDAANSTVGTVTTNTDVRGTDSAALATALTTAQNDLDTITGADGATLATIQTQVGQINGAAATGTLSTTQCTSDLTGYLTSELIGRTITFTGGTANGQKARITAYTATNGDIEFTTITTAPANADTFVIT